MGFFGSRKKDVIDLTEGYNRNKIKAETLSKETQSREKTQDSSGFVPLGFFADSSPVPKKESFSETSFDSGDAQDRKRKLARRLVDMTEKIEDLSNQIYHLQQRVELIERKVNPNNFNQEI
jgi:hypothetical protein